MWRVLQVAALVLVAFSFFKVVQNFNVPLSQPPREVFLRFVYVMNHSQETVAAVVADHDVSGVDATVRIRPSTYARTGLHFG